MIPNNNFTYTCDDYDNFKDHKREETRQHKAKIPRPFSTTVRQRTTFTKDKQDYNNEGVGKDHKVKYVYPPADHTGPFKPSHPAKKGYNKTIEHFPTYIEDQGKKVAQKSIEHYAKHTGYWKHPTYYKSKVSTTIHGNFRNERKHFF